MKRILTFIMVFLTLMTSFSFGNVNFPQQRMIMDGQSINFYVVQLALDGQIVKSDVPPVLHNDRTLVPVRIISEHIGAEVEWNQDTYQATITTEDQEIILTIDSATAIVNGQTRQLPDGVPAKIVTYNGQGRTLVPIRFVSETLGLDVDWNNDTRTVLVNQKRESENNKPDQDQAISIKDFNVVTRSGVPEIRIETGERVTHSELRLVNPDRLVIDLKNAKLDLTDQSKLNANNLVRIPINNGILEEVRASQFEVNPHTTRVVMELNKAINHQVVYDSVTGEMVIRFVNEVNHVRVDQFNMKEVVVIEGSFVEDYNVMRLSNPERLVVDVKGSKLNSRAIIPERNVQGKVISGIRVAQFEPDHHYQPDDQIVRTVIDLKGKKSTDDFHFEVRENQLIVHLEGKPYESIIYEETGWTTSTLILSAQRSTNFTVNQTNGSNRLNITVPKNDFDREFPNIKIADHIIKEIRLLESGANHYLIEIQLEEDVEYEVLSSNPSKDFVLVLNNEGAQYRRRLIVIDAGHGGTDPGAISPNLKLKESDVVLDVAQRLNKLLMDAGFRTYMIRDNDTFVGLHDRAQIANQLQADLFVSIHANAAANTSVSGTETFYFKGAQTNEREILSRRLAQLFQEELVKELQSNNRGVKTANFVVVRETTMPAILNEIGFLTNPNEENKLATSAYRQKSAEAMYRAIVRYFEELK